jgi:hypothetical protein
MHSILRVFLLLVISASASAAGLSALSDREAAGGLKEALTQGATRAVEMLSGRDGFLANPKVKIPLPDALAQGEGLMRMMGRGDDLDQLVTGMNRAAEAAVPEAKALLIAAVKKMSVDDAKKVLSGGDDSVTTYFKDKTLKDLTARFLPIVKGTTDRFSLAEQYNKFAGQAAGFGLVGSEDAKIENYVTRKAMDGLFLMIAEEERAIRQNPVAAAGSLAKKVFGALGQ